MVPPACQPDHAQKLFGPRFRFDRPRPFSICGIMTFSRRKFGKKTMELEHETDMTGPQAPAPAAAKRACRRAIDKHLALIRPLQQAGDVQQR